MVRLLRGYLLASLAAAIAFTIAIAALEGERNAGNILAGLAVFLVFALGYTAVLAPIGRLALGRLRREGLLAHGVAGTVLGWLSSLVLFRSPGGLVEPMAAAFTLAGLAAGVAFRITYGAVPRRGAPGEPRPHAPDPDGGLAR